MPHARRRNEGRDGGYLGGRAAWVTGGASGQGRAIALALAGAGADIAIGSVLASERASILPIEDTYLAPEEELEQTREEIEALGVKAVARGLDVRSDESVQAFFDAATAAFGKIDILANAAGGGGEQAMVGHSDEVWDHIINTNLNGNYRTIKRCLPGMIERKWGRIVNIAATAASVGAVGNGAYCASKAGIAGLTRCIALEGAAHGVTCNAISPGWVDTKMAESSTRRLIELEGSNKTVEEYFAEVAASYPQKRLIDPAEIGAVAAFLCHEEAFGMTMRDLTVSAGALW